MQKFFIRYHIVGNKIVTDAREFESFGEAVSYTSKGLRNGVIGIAKNDDHVVEMQTKHITHHEVMSVEVAKKERDIQQMSNLVQSAFK